MFLLAVSSILIVEHAVDGIVYINHFFPVGVISGFIGKMKIFTDKFLPSSLNPLLF